MDAALLLDIVDLLVVAPPGVAGTWHPVSPVTESERAAVRLLRQGLVALDAPRRMISLTPDGEYLRKRALDLLGTIRRPGYCATGEVA